MHENTSINRADFFAEHIGASMNIVGSDYWSENNIDEAKLVGVKYEYSDMTGERSAIIILESVDEDIDGGLILMKPDDCTLIRRNLWNIQNWEAYDLAKILVESYEPIVSSRGNFYTIHNPSTVHDDILTVQVDEDSRHVCQIQIDREDYDFSIYANNQDKSIGLKESIEGHQFLKSCGFATPYRGLDIDDLKSYGWIEVEEQFDDDDLPF